MNDINSNPGDPEIPSNKLSNPAKESLTLTGIVKRFGSTVALDHVDFSLFRGEIHAVLGENGAGKSTLMNIIRGLTRPDGGTIEVDGVRAEFRSSESARRHGIGMVHQHFMLVPAFSVIDNLVLADPDRSWNVGRRRQELSARATQIGDRLGWRIPLDARIADLPVGAQQRIEIVRALLADARILLFDEPTAVLAPTETIDLFEVLRSLRSDGRSVIFVSHKLSEVMALCDRVTVMRLGRVVGRVSINATNPEDLAARMVGTAEIDGTIAAAIDLDDQTLRTSPSALSDSLVSRSGETGHSRVVLRLDSVSTKGYDHSIDLKNITFDLPEGTILGFAGVDGNGQTELAEVLTGGRRCSGGTIEIDGVPTPQMCQADLDRLGIAFIPPDRHRDGLALDLSVADNLTLSAAQLSEFCNGPFLRRKQLTEYAGKLASEFDIRTTNLRAPVRSLSGGNQQKIVVARALAKRPKVLIAVSPTRGLDVAATAYIHHRLRRHAEEGGAIVLISTELDEVISLSDQVAVLSEGRIIDIVPPDTPRQAIGMMMGGSPVHA